MLNEYLRSWQFLIDAVTKLQEPQLSFHVGGSISIIHRSNLIGQF